MKKLILLLLVVSMASCIAPYHTRHQSRTMRNFDKPKGFRDYPSAHRRGDYNHPAVRKETRRALSERH